MPFGSYKDFDECVRKNKNKSDPKAYCGWLKKRIEGKDERVLFYIYNPSVVSKLYALDNAKQLSSDAVMRLLTKDRAHAILKNPSSLKKDQDATVIDDHRWIHMWANTIRDGNDLFITKEQLRKLHTMYVDEFMRRGFNHQSALKFEVFNLMDVQLKELLLKRKPFQLDESFISFIGSSLTEKEDPNNMDVVIKSVKNAEYGEAYLESLPEGVRERQKLWFELGGPSGPYIPGYELWAIPSKDVSVKEPKFSIQPMSPFPPAKASEIKDLSTLSEDSYYAIMPRGIRLMVHRNRAEVIAYDNDLEEYELPDVVKEAVLKLEDPQTFILDGFLTSKGYAMIDMPWWRESQHINHSAEVRRNFMNKLSRNDVVDFAETKNFTCKKDVVAFLQQEKGPYLLVPGSSIYPINGEGDWLLYSNEDLKLSDKKLAYLVRGRYGFESPLACCLSPWVATQNGEGDWTYFHHDDAVYDKLKELGITTLVGTETDANLLEVWREKGLEFSVQEATTISELLAPPLLLTEGELPTEMKLDVAELKMFYAGNHSSPINHMTVSCCESLVALNKPLHLENVYMANPSEAEKWKYVIQFHVRGLAVHADFRAQIDSKRLIGWTWNVGKSLLRPMMRRLNDDVLTQLDVSREQIDELTQNQLARQVISTDAGKKLIKQLKMKVKELSQGQLKTLANEVWKDEFQPMLDDPDNRILSQRKPPESIEWLEYEGELPAGAVGATRELTGRFILMDSGFVEFGAQKPNFHEYWLNGSRVNGRIIVRKLATKPEWKIKASAWMTFVKTSNEAPHVISSSAVSEKWIPKGVSALPKAVRMAIPEEYRYWKKKNSMEIRDGLVRAMAKKEVMVKLTGLKFAVSQDHDSRNWLLLHDGSKVLDAWNFGKDSPAVGVTARRRKDLKVDQFNTIDEGSAQIVGDTDDILQLSLNGNSLKGAYVFVKNSGESEVWTLAKSDLPEPKKAKLLAAMECTTGYCQTTGIMHLSANDFKHNKSGNLLFINGPAIKPGEVIPMDGKPAFFTKEGIAKFWPSMNRQPIVVLHGELKGDVIGYVDKIHYDANTGWGWIDRGVVWHPMGIKMILDGTLPAFSIEVIPDVIWDPEHQHEHVVGGSCVGVAVVPVGACKTCNIVGAEFSEVKAQPGQVYKFGMTTDQYLLSQYWGQSKSTKQISDVMGIARSTIESWMRKLNIPRRNYKEARHLRGRKERAIKLGGRTSLTALGTGVSPRSDVGKDNRNTACTLLSIETNHLLINAPKNINAMLGLVQLTPKNVLLEHAGESAVGGLHELRALKMNVFATSEVWKELRLKYRQLSGQKGSFEDIYNFPRYVIKDKSFILGEGGFVVAPMKVSSPSKATAYKINAGGVIVWHSSDIKSITGKHLEGVHVYVGDGSTEKGHASLEEQIKWASDAGVRQIFFTKIGVDYSHEDLSDKLREMSPNAQPLFDGAKFGLNTGSTAAILPDKIVEGLVKSEKVIIVRTKPYSEFAKQTLLFGTEKELAGLYIEGFPEGPHSADKVKAMKDQHQLSDKEWKSTVGDAKNVWIYHPRTLKVFDEPKEYMANDATRIGPYANEVSIT